MKCLVFTPSSFCDPHFGMQLEEAESLYQAGNDVFITFCDGLCRYCANNPYGDPLLCKFCRFCTKKWLSKNLSPGITIIPLKRKKLPDHTWSYLSTQDIKKIIYKNVHIGYGVMSSYTSATRDPDPSFQQKATKKFFDFALNHAALLTDQYSALIEQIQPEIVSIFNGRFIEHKPLYDLAKKNKIVLHVNECIGGTRSDTPVERIIYYNHLPHSVPYNTELLHKVWAMPNESEEEKQRKGRDFFERRRNGIPAGDRVYIDKQQKGLLPTGWDNSKRNIVIFNSSEDEFSAIGKDFDDYALFPTQYEGIETILSKFTSPEYHFYLRIHPNLSKIKFNYHMDLYKLPQKYKNITVIAATDPCSTYDLLDAAEKVIVFGSTMGAESVYWGKPTILLAGAFYYLLDICYLPKSISEMYDFIEQHLQPTSKECAIKYGYYLLNRNLLTIPAKYVDSKLYKLKFRNWEFYVSGYAKIFGSRWITKILRILLVMLASKRKYYNLPQPVFFEHTFKKSNKK